MELAFTQSQLRDYTKFDPRSKFGLTEHFYGLDIKGLLQPTIEKVWKNLDAFIASPRKDRISKYFSGGYKTYIENPTTPNFDNMKVDLSKIPELKDVSLMAAPDFVVVLGENNYIILDWKSGKEKLDEDEITDQLKIYALKMILNR